MAAYQNAFGLGGSGGSRRSSVLEQIRNQLLQEQSVRQSQPGYGQPDPVPNLGYSAFNGYSYPNGYSQPVFTPRTGGFAPRQLSQNPVDSQFAMGGNSMSRLVALAQQQRQQQSMVPQFQQQAPLQQQVAVAPQQAVAWRGPQPVQTPMRTESGETIYALPPRSPGDGGGAYVGDQSLLRQRGMLTRDANGNYTPMKDAGYDAYAESRKPSKEEMVQRQIDRNNRVAQTKADRLTNRQRRLGLSSDRQANREKYFGVANSRNRSLIPQVASQSPDNAQANSNPGDNPYIGNSGPVPGMNFDVNGIQAGDIMRAIMRSREIGDPKERKKAMEDAGLDAKTLKKYVDEFIKKPNRFDGFFDGGDPLQEGSVNREFAATVDDIAEIYPELKKRKLSKEEKSNLPAAGWKSTPGFRIPKIPSLVPSTPLM